MQVESVNAVEVDQTLGKKTPRVSVCVVTYNQEKYIAQCLQSIVDQETDFDFEIIVGDDFSTDGTREIVWDFAGKYPEKFRLFLHEKNIGAYRNFQFVHEQALGQYVAHVDGDDYALPDKLAAQAAILDANHECNAVWHRADYFNDSGEFCSGQTADLRIFKEGRVEFSDAVRLGFVGIHSSLMYRRAAREIVPIDQPCLDLYYTWGLLSTGHGHFVDKVLGAYRVGAVGSISTSNAAAISKLTVQHAQIFLDRFPDQRKNFALWSITNAIIHGKNLRSSAFLHLKFFVRNISFLWPWVIWKNLIDVRSIQAKWKNRKKSKFGEA